MQARLQSDIERLEQGIAAGLAREQALAGTIDSLQVCGFPSPPPSTLHSTLFYGPLSRSALPNPVFDSLPYIGLVFTRADGVYRAAFVGALWNTWSAICVQNECPHWSLCV